MRDRSSSGGAGIDSILEMRGAAVMEHNLHERDDDIPMLVEELGERVDHGLASASDKESIMVQKRPKVPLVKRVSCAGRITPTGTSYGA